MLRATEARGMRVVRWLIFWSGLWEGEDGQGVLLFWGGTIDWGSAGLAVVMGWVKAGMVIWYSNMVVW